VSHYQTLRAFAAASDSLAQQHLINTHLDRAIMPDGRLDFLSIFLAAKAAELTAEQCAHLDRMLEAAFAFGVSMKERD